MNVNITHYENVAVLAVKDELAGDTVELFNRDAAQCLDEDRFNILVDCTTVGYFDSAGLEALFDLQNKCEDELGAAKLCGLDETCTKILEITRLARRFEVFDDLESAVKSFG